MDGFYVLECFRLLVEYPLSWFSSFFSVIKWKKSQNDSLPSLILITIEILRFSRQIFIFPWFSKVPFLSEYFSSFVNESSFILTKTFSAQRRHAKQVYDIRQGLVSKQDGNHGDYFWYYPIWLEDNDSRMLILPLPMWSSDSRLLEEISNSASLPKADLR